MAVQTAIALCLLAALAVGGVSASSRSPPRRPPPKMPNPSCFEITKALAPHDFLLGENTVDERLSRLYQKRTVAPAVQDAAGFANVFTSLKSRGNGFSCGYTSSWVSELFEGIEGQYAYWLADGPGDNTRANTAAGYGKFVGANLTQLFTTHASSNDGYIFQVYHGGSADHVLLIEQLPNKQGYRVHQSYNSVYSLNAWLNPTASESELAKAWGPNPSAGDIVPNSKLYNIMNTQISAATGGAFNVTNLPPAALLAGLPGGANLIAYITFWANQSVNKTQIIADLAASKAKYGGGRIIPAAEFNSGYLATFAKLADWYTTNGGTGSKAIVPADIFHGWTDLYGSPNPLLGSGLPYDVVDGTKPSYFLQVRTVKTTGANCWHNARSLYASLNKPWKWAA